MRFLVCSDAHHVGDLEILIQFPILIDMFQHSLKTTSEQASLEKKKHPIQGEWSCCNHLCWTKSGLGVEFFTDPIVVDTISMWLCLKICYHQFQWVIILFPMKLYEKNDQIAHFQPIKPWLFSSANRQSRISWLTPGTRWFRAWSKASPKFPAMISSRWAPRVSGPGS